MKSKLSIKSAVTLENVDGVDFIYFVDQQTLETLRLELSVLLAWLEQEIEPAAPAAHAASHAAAGGDPITPAAIGAATQSDHDDLGDAVEATYNLAAGAAAQALDALGPFVAEVHTAATLTLVVGHAGDITPVDSSLGALEVHVGSTLWQALGANRAFACTLRIDDATNPILFIPVGEGMTVIPHGYSTVQAGDYVTVLVDSATTARVFVARPLP